MSSSSETNLDSKRRVCIIGGGAAGIAAAWSLGRHPDKFEVQLWEKCSVPGGVATSIDVGGGQFINDGVQGGTPTYRNLINLHRELGLEHHPVWFTVSFGKDETCWNNWRERDLVKKLRPEIKRFGEVLKWVNRMEPSSVVIPISSLLNLCGFPQEFGELMVYPLVALFFGTGNQTPRISSAVVARVFLDPDLRLFEYCPERLLNQKPQMFAFQRLEDVYLKIAEHCGPSVKFCFDRPASRIVRKSSRHRSVEVTDIHGVTESFDDLIIACDAETALRILRNPSFWEKRCLGGVEYFDDVTITHEDMDYMLANYDVDLDVDQYFVRTDPRDRSKIEMSFNLSNYQPQLKEKNGGRNIFQTIFLDKQESGLWTIDDINKDKILCEKWWRQMAHSWKHFVTVPPLVRFIQGHKHTWYCGSWTLANTHEVATISGLAAAYRIGADYPFEDDEFAHKQFSFYIETIHGLSSACSKCATALKGTGAVLGLLCFGWTIPIILAGVYLNGRRLKSQAERRLRQNDKRPTNGKQ